MYVKMSLNTSQLKQIGKHIFYLNIKAFFVWVLLFSGLIISCKDAVVLTDNASIHFRQTSHDFGQLALNKEASIVFEFENNGNEPLQISDVQTTCGCTVPTWTKDIIKVSETGKIEVSYDSKFPGRFIKTITVFYNGKNSPQELKIKGQVAYPKEDGI